MPDSEQVHVAGPTLTIDGRWMRQRCCWCGAVLVDYDLTKIGVPEGQDGPSGWPETGLVSMNGGVSWLVEPDEDGKIPENCCMSLDPEVTR